MGTVQVSAQPFDHQNGGDWPGMRGRILSAPTGFASGRAFSTDFPDVFVTDSGEVEMGDGLRVPVDAFRQWLAALAEELA